MFECIVYMPFPLKDKGESYKPTVTSVVKYGYDPGLQVGDEVSIQDWQMGYWGSETFNFKATVVKREKIIKPKKSQEKEDNFVIAIVVELADKEELPRMRKVLMELNPGQFEDYEPQEKN